MAIVILKEIEGVETKNSEIISRCETFEHLSICDWSKVFVISSISAIFQLLLIHVGWLLRNVPRVRLLVQLVNLPPMTVQACATAFDANLTPKRETR
jgi:hypothetical protein